MAKHKNIGGAAKWYQGKGSHVAEEAEKKAGVAARGGRQRKFGGRAVGAHSGAKTAPRLDRRARGGSVGADHSPFSSAARASDIKRTTLTPPSLGRHAHTNRVGGNPPKPYKHGGHVSHDDGGKHGLMHKHARGGSVSKKKN